MAAGVSKRRGALRQRGYRPWLQARGPGTGVSDPRIGADAARREGEGLWAQALARGLGVGLQPATC